MSGSGAGRPHDSAEALHDPVRMRQAGPELLSLALMEARNRTLAWLGLFDGVDAPPPQLPEAFEPALWLAGHAGWYQERWIGRNLQRSRGAACDLRHSALASIEPAADECWDPSASAPAARWQQSLPDAQATRSYLEHTLEATLDLLRGVGEDDDDGLHWFRAALWHEDGLVERFAALAQGQGVAEAQSLAGPQPSRAQREPLWFGAQRFLLGSPRGGFVPEPERWAHEVQVPEFEIDAQPVNWAQYAEFVEDGGYDEPQWWSAEGQRWLEATARRCPRDVEQLRHGVMLRRFGRLQRAASAQAAVQVSAHEARAWCAWAGRRLATEAEWELAAVQGRSRGFVFGDVLEWVAGRAQAWPGGEAFPGGASLHVLRGGPWCTPRRRLHPRSRRFAEPDRDEAFTGFRSCAV